jgi:hypothetical protein
LGDELMKNSICASAVILFLLGCISKEEEARRLEKLDETTFTTTAYNYTKYDIFSILYKDVSVPFDVENAANGGSVFFRNAGKKLLDNGQEVAGGGDTCCLIWNKETDKPLKIKVVWSVIYDLDSFDGKLSDQRDKRSLKGRGRGSAWCEAVVEVQPADRDLKADRVILHFLVDGTVQATLATFQTEKPLSSSLVEQHAVVLPEGQFCKNEIDNPFFGIPRAPHRE